jgi:hypothetical protein
MTISIRFLKILASVFLEEFRDISEKSEKRHDQRTRRPNEEHCLDDANEKMFSTILGAKALCTRPRRRAWSGSSRSSMLRASGLKNAGIHGCF